MIKDPIVMTRRLALGGSVCASVVALSATPASTQSGSRGAPIGEALAGLIKGSLQGADLENLVDLMHPAVRTVAWTGVAELDVVGPAAYRSQYLAPYLRLAGFQDDGHQGAEERHRGGCLL